jgi:hypothetical protein
MSSSNQKIELYSVVACSTRAAMIYLHSTSERQRALADTLGALVATKLKGEQADSKASGTEVAHHGADGA